MFIKLTEADSRLDIHIAVDQIASFTAYDRYRPHGISWLAMKDGTRRQVSESADEIAARIAAAS